MQSFPNDKQRLVHQDTQSKVVPVFFALQGSTSYDEVLIYEKIGMKPALAVFDERKE